MTRSSETPNAGWRWSVVAILMLSSLAAAAASETNYRLAGVVGIAGEGALALIELPDGRQRLLREGDALGDGRIREITAAGVRIELGHDDLLLRLRGKPVLVASVRDEAASAEDETDPASPDNASENEPAPADDASETEGENERKQEPSASEVTPQE